MQTPKPDTKSIQRKMLGFYCFVLAIMLMGNQVASVKHSAVLSERPFWLIQNKDVEKEFNVSEILLAIKSFSLHDMENADNQ